MSSRRTWLGVTAALVLVLAALSQLTAPDGALPTATVVPVVSTELICPDARARADGHVRTSLSAVTPQQFTVGPGGRALVGTTNAPASIATLSGSNRASVTFTGNGEYSVVGRGINGRAPGFAMDQLSVSQRRDDHGLSGVTCGEADNDTWFVGTASGIGQYSTLYLTDPENTPATVDVLLYGKNGRIDAPGGLGLQVRGDSRRIVRIDRLAPGAGPLAVHVVATAGRVGASLFDARVNGLEPLGSDWMPASAQPSTRVVVPGVAGGRGGRRLVLFAPSRTTASVTVRLVGTQGSFAPAGAASLELDGGRVTSVKLGKALAGDDSALVIESSAPVVAGLRWDSSASRVHDLAFTAGSTPLTAPAVLAGNRNDSGFRTWLILSAPAGAGRVSIQPMVSGVPVRTPTVVKVGADRTVRVLMPRPLRKGSYQVVITPVAGSGPVYAAVVRAKQVDGATGVTIATVQNTRITVGVPAARPNLEVGLGR